MTEDNTPVHRPDEVEGPPPTADPMAGLLGGLDMGALLSMAGDMQQQLESAQDQAAATEVEGSSGGGAVRVRMTGAYECVEVNFVPDLNADVALLEDLVLAAIRDALDKVEKVRQAGDPFGGLGDQLGGLFGG